MIQVFNCRPVSAPTMDVVKSHFLVTIYAGLISHPYFLQLIFRKTIFVFGHKDVRLKFMH